MAMDSDNTDFLPHKCATGPRRRLTDGVRKASGQAAGGSRLAGTGGVAWVAWAPAWASGATAGKRGSGGCTACASGATSEE